MLEAIGAESLEELFAMVPAELRLGRRCDVPPAMGELELTAHLAALAARNTSAGRRACFLGGGSYDHFIPAVVDFVASRSEFYTSYTPYQAEVSQGNLQALFEYQTLITQLTGMDVSNSSLYDGGSAAAEAVLMAMHATRRTGRVVTAAQRPSRISADPGHVPGQPGRRTGDARPRPTARLARASFERRQRPDGLRAGAASQLLRLPGRDGSAGRVAHAAGALLVVVVDPISLGLLKRPGEYGADIVVAEGQSLGNPMSFGGPYLGIMACREEFVRRMPGRLVGQTVDRRGKRCWVLTLQTREQHIRRDKATSNICTNQGLLALRAAVYLAAMGPHGLRASGRAVPAKGPLRGRAADGRGRWSLAFARPTFKEFVVRTAGGRVDELLDAAMRQSIFAGVPLGRWYPELDDCLLVAVTEKRTKAEIDRLAALCTGECRDPKQENAQMQKSKSNLNDNSANCLFEIETWLSESRPQAYAESHPCETLKQLLFELSKPGCQAVRLPACDVPQRPPGRAAAGRRRWPHEPPPLPELAEPELVRHFVNLSTLNMSVDTHFYPLGSCTMKYNPKRNERLAGLPGLLDLHPYQPEATLQGLLELLYQSQQMLAEIAGLPAVSLQPAAGAHGELTALLVAAAYFRDLGQKRHGGADSRRRPRHQSGQRRHGRLPRRSRSRARRDGFVDLDDLAARLDRPGGRLHDYQPQHAGHVRAAHRARSPGWCMRWAGWSTWTAPT